LKAEKLPFRTKSFSALDEKIYSDDLASYTLYMGLGGLQKRAVVRNKKFSDKLVVVAADKPADAFDMSEGDVLISFGKDAPKTLRRVSDIHSEKNGIGMIYRTICICRNMIRCTALSAGYLVCAQVAAMIFCLFGMISSFFVSGALPLGIPELLGSVFVTDLIISLLTAFIKTPSSIISDKPAAFLSYYNSARIMPKAVFAGIMCGFSSFFAYLIGFMQLKSFEAAGCCAFFVMFLSKCLVSLFCIMRTSTRKAPAPFPKTAAVGELICGILFAFVYSRSFIPFSYGYRITGVLLIISILPSVLSELYVKIDNRE